MVKTKNIKVVTEDAVVGDKCKESSKSFGMGYDKFQYPYTVSFCSEGKYEVVIEGKKARVIKVK